MNKTPRLSKSGIEYLDYSWGIYSGCHNLQAGICPVKACWAKGIALHYPKLYPDGFEPHYYPEAIDSPKHLKKPSRIGVGWVGDIIGYGLAFREQIFETIRQCPQHTFLFLTKNPDRLSSWGKFPDNCFVGVTATNWLMFSDALGHLASIQAMVKYISFEPLLERIQFDMMQKMLFPQVVNWVILGAQTKPTVYPELSWVQTIALAATKANIPLFLKDNLKPLLPNRMPFWGVYIWKELSAGVPITMSENRYRQEVPE